MSHTIKYFKAELFEDGRLVNTVYEDSLEAIYASMPLLRLLNFKLYINTLKGFCFLEAENKNRYYNLKIYEVSATCISSDAMGTFNNLLIKGK